MYTIFFSMFDIFIVESVLTEKVAEMDYLHRRAGVYDDILAGIKDAFFWQYDFNAQMEMEAYLDGSLNYD